MRRIAVLALFALLFAWVAVAQEHAPSATPEHGAQPAAEKSEHSEGEGEGNLEIWKWANFAILAGLLGWMIAKNAPAFFRTRTEEIQKGIAEASRMKDEADARAARMEMKMASLKSEIDNLRNEAKAEMAKEAARIAQETEQQLARFQAHGEQEITALAAHAEKDLKAQAAALAVELAEQRIRGRMSGDAQNSLFDGFLRQLDRQAGQTGARQ